MERYAENKFRKIFFMSKAVFLDVRPCSLVEAEQLFRLFCSVHYEV